MTTYDNEAYKVDRCGFAPASSGRGDGVVGYLGGYGTN